MKGSAFFSASTFNNSAQCVSHEGAWPSASSWRPVNPAQSVPSRSCLEGPLRGSGLASHASRKSCSGGRNPLVAPRSFSAFWRTVAMRTGLPRQPTTWSQTRRRTIRPLWPRLSLRKPRWQRLKQRTRRPRSFSRKPLTGTAPLRGNPRGSRWTWRRRMRMWTRLGNSPTSERPNATIARLTLTGMQRRLRRRSPTWATSRIQPPTQRLHWMPPRNRLPWRQQEPPSLRRDTTP
mmetsp:Transcript_854/g.1980  ORF Transcript_854/g.1980 Transcript_854/m.1980 type:complete len:234 (+) Transcript_854:1003-1704(+)